MLHDVYVARTANDGRVQEWFTMASVSTPAEAPALFLIE
jgi:hypothetical protein